MKALILNDIRGVEPPSTPPAVYDESVGGDIKVSLPSVTVGKDGVRDLIGWLSLLIAEHNYP